jgi:hypothetical protein
MFAVMENHSADVLAMFCNSANALKVRGIILPKPENFEADLVGFMKLWGSSPRLGMSVDATTEARMWNVARFLADATFSTEHCPEPKTILQTAEVELLRGFIELACMVGGVFVTVSQLPPSPGYEPLFKESGFDPVSARGMAHLIVRSGKRQAKERQLRRSVVRAIRALARRCQNNKPALEQAKFLLQVADESSIVDTICCEAGLRETDLLPLLQATLDGQQVDQRRIVEIVSRLGPALSTPRGPKLSAASAAHEFLLDPELPVLAGRNAYTWSDIDGNFTDALTRATRIEFSDPNFDPRPARRRIKERQCAKTA